MGHSNTLSLSHTLTLTLTLTLTHTHTRTFPTSTHPSPPPIPFLLTHTAYDMLSNPVMRRMYDSVDDVDDSVPSVTKDAKVFYNNFGKAFARNSR